MTGYPAEMGLYLTVLKPFGLHRVDDDGAMDFFEPDGSPEGLSLKAAWEVLQESRDVTLDEVYARWSAPPLGIKSGVMAPLALAYLMANRDRVAVYIDGVFQAAFDDFLVDKLLQKPDLFRLRHIDRSVREASFLSGLSELFDVELDSSSLPLARTLYRRYEELPPYAERTHHLSADTLLIRSIIKKSTDPEALLIDVLPGELGERLSPELVHDAVIEMEGAYPELLARVRLALAKSLGVDPGTFAGIGQRAESIKDLTNDYNLEAFAMRAAAFENGGGDVEGLSSLLLHKPASSWSDRDREQALTEVARFGRRFRELEALAGVRGRRSETEAMALVVGVDPSTRPLLQSFELSEQEKYTASLLADRVLETLRAEGTDDHMHLAALARAITKLAEASAKQAEAA